MRPFCASCSGAMNGGLPVRPDKSVPRPLGVKIRTALPSEGRTFEVGVKLLSPEAKAWLRRTQERRWSNRLHHAKVSLAKRKGLRLKARFYVGHKRTRRAWVSAHGKQMPEDFCLETNYAEVSAFLHDLRITTHSNLEDWINKGRPRNRSKRVNDWHDVSTIKRITPSAALVLTAEYDRIRRISGSKWFAINIDKWSPEVLSVLDQLGLFEIMEVNKSAKCLNAPLGKANLFVLPMRSGDKVIGSEADDMNRELATVAIEAAYHPKSSGMGVEKEPEEWLNKAAGIYAILIEAMDNVITHAYPAGHVSEFRTLRRWWMTAAIDRGERKLTVAIYDQGISIPVSLPTWQNYGKLQRFARRVFGRSHNPRDQTQDGEAIRIATRVAVSATRRSYRGKGLAVMAEFIHQCRDGRLRILSRCGECLYTKRDGYTVRSHPLSIGGTLVEWEVLL